MTVEGSFFSLRLIKNPAIFEKLSKLIHTHGYFPKEYTRKYPRIPFDVNIPVFPHRAVFVPSKSTPGLGAPVSAEIVNLSPSGMMVATENPLAQILSPGKQVDFFLEPRGPFQHLIRVQGLICRAANEVEPINGNTVQTFGIQFARLEDADKAAFLDLLKTILDRMKS
jgi:hypothetical protein